MKKYLTILILALFLQTTLKYMGTGLCLYGLYFGSKNIYCSDSAGKSMSGLFITGTSASILTIMWGGQK